MWTDPDFDAQRRVVYYARVLESPSCRWSARQCLAFAAEDRPSGCADPQVVPLIRERAWTAPIWYAPEG